MTKQQTVNVRSDVDVITARMRVREIARRIGMGLTDQSCISLATSSLADAMGLSKGTVSGQITIEPLENGSRVGVKVICVNHALKENRSDSSTFRSLRWMVDELEVNTELNEGIQVSVTKWMAS